MIFAVCVSSAFAFDGEEIWHVKLDAPLSSGITAAKSMLFLGDMSGTFYALDRDTGAKLWSYNGSGSICGTPTLAGEVVIIAQADGEITCLKTSDGSLVWTSKPESYNAIMSDGVVKGDGRAYAAKNDGKVYALDLSDGSLLWTYTAKQILRTAPAYDKGLIFQGENDGIFSILDAKTGKRLNGGGAGGAVNTPVILGDNVYFSSWDGSLNAVRIKDVSPLWHVNVKDPITTSPAIEAGKIIVGTGRGYIIALDQETGKELWRFETKGGTVTAKPIIFDGHVLAGAGHGNVYVLNIEDGSIKFVTGAGGGIEQTPAAYDGVFYFGNSGGYLYAVH